MLGRLRLRRWREWTLRSRMVVTVVGLAAVTLVLTNLAGAAALRGYLGNQLDTEVTRLSHFGERPGPGNRGGLFGGNTPGNTSGPDDPRPTPSGAPAPQSSSGVPSWLRDGRGPGFTEGVGNPSMYILYDASGRVLFEPSHTSVAAGPELGSFAALTHRAGQGIFTASSPDGTERFRVEVNRTPAGNYGVAAISLTRVDATTNTMLTIGLVASALALLGLGLAAHTVVRLGLRPLTRMEGAAAEIAGGDLTLRVPDTDPHTEPGRLGLALNTMLGRIESAVADRTASEQRLRQFLADASHELRTPLTSIRGFAELYRRGGAPPGPELDETMSRIEDEAARMGLLVEDLLLLAALDEERPLQRGQVDLLAVAADAVRDAHVRAPQRKVELAGFEPVTVLGDEHRLRQVVTNLVANALQHTPPDAQITLRISRRGGDPADRFELPAHREHAPVVAAVGVALPSDAELAVVEVSDTGPGVPPEHSDRIFERLYRADPHRARSHGGAGLGLAIATAIVKAHSGRVELATAPGAGATFRVLLPLNP